MLDSIMESSAVNNYFRSADTSCSGLSIQGQIFLSMNSLSSNGRQKPKEVSISTKSCVTLFSQYVLVKLLKSTKFSRVVFDIKSASC